MLSFDRPNVCFSYIPTCVYIKWHALSLLPGEFLVSFFLYSLSLSSSNNSNLHSFVPWLPLFRLCSRDLRELGMHFLLHLTLFSKCFWDSKTDSVSVSPSLSLCLSPLSIISSNRVSVFLFLVMKTKEKKEEGMVSFTCFLASSRSRLKDPLLPLFTFYLNAPLLSVFCKFLEQVFNIWGISPSCSFYLIGSGDENIYNHIFNIHHRINHLYMYLFIINS